MQQQSIGLNITGIVTQFVSNKSLNYSSIQRHVHSSNFQSGRNSVTFNQSKNHSTS